MTYSNPLANKNAESVFVPLLGIMNKTKKKIIIAAIDLFNEQGMANVRNQDVAEKTGISLSNFNYHFATRKDLVLEVIAYMQHKLNHEVYGGQALLTQDGQGLEIAVSYFEFERDFRFFYLDTHNILQMFPELQEGLKKQIHHAIQVIKNINYMGIGKGYLQPPPPDMPHIYDALAHQIWINNHFWFAQMHIRGEEGDLVHKGMESIYSISYPYMTDLGKERFRQFLDERWGG